MSVGEKDLIGGVKLIPKLQLMAVLISVFEIYLVLLWNIMNEGGHLTEFSLGCPAVVEVLGVPLYFQLRW